MRYISKQQDREKSSVDFEDVKRVKQMLEEFKIKAPEDISSNLNGDRAGAPGIMRSYRSFETASTMAVDHSVPGSSQERSRRGGISTATANGVLGHPAPPGSATADPTSEDTGYSLEEERRIVLVGKTGVGKSATGNTILGGVRFQSERSPRSITKECQKESCPEKKITVVDTPGLLDTDTSEDDTIDSITACCALSPEGFHAIVLVLSVTARFTDEEKEAVQRVKDMFGPGAEKYMMVLFTSEDQLETQTIQDYVKESEQLRQLVAGCGNRFCAFNNKKTGLESRQQVAQLFTIIDRMVEENGGLGYTIEMFQVAGEVVRRQEGLRFRGTNSATTHTDAHINEPEVNEEKIQRKAENDVIDTAKLLRKILIAAGGVIGGVAGGCAGGITGNCAGGIAGGIVGGIAGGIAGAVIGVVVVIKIYEKVTWIYQKIKEIFKVHQIDHITDVIKHFI